MLLTVWGYWLEDIFLLRFSRAVCMSSWRCVRCVSWADRCVCATGPIHPHEVETADSRAKRARVEEDATDTDFARQNELREEQEDCWHDDICDSFSDSQDTVASDEVFEILSECSRWIRESLPAECEQALDDLDEEDHLLSSFEQTQDWEDFARDLAVLQEREASEWPEDMRRQYDESALTAHRRQLILEIVRGFLRA